MDKRGEKYCYCIKQDDSLKDIQAWYLGESKELEKWIGFGFFNHLFISKNKIVRLYYNYEDGENFWKVLNEKLTEDLFHNLCDNLIELIEQSKTTNSEQELFKIYVKCWPAWTIFDEISKYPELATPLMLTRLIRLRKTTEAFSYDLSKRLNHTNLPEDYILFKGKLFFKPFDDFTKENNIFIENE